MTFGIYIHDASCPPSCEGSTGVLHEIEHCLKTWPDVFREIKEGTKVHEFRKNDRDFRRGDLVLLREFVPAGERYTGEMILARIMSISYGPEWGIGEGWTAFSIETLKNEIIEFDTGE